MFATAGRRGGPLVGLLRELHRGLGAPALAEELQNAVFGGSSLLLDNAPRFEQQLLTLRHFSSPAAPLPKSSGRERRKQAKPEKARSSPGPRKNASKGPVSSIHPGSSGEKHIEKLTANTAAARAGAASAAATLAAPKPPPDSAADSSSQASEAGAEQQDGRPELSFKAIKAEAALLKKAGKPFQASELGLHALQQSMRRFFDSARMKDRALALYVSAMAFPRLSNAFRKDLMASITPALQEEFLQMDKSQRLETLFNLFAEYVVLKHSDEIQAYRDAVRTMDLRKPYLWYPVARSLQRRFIYHAGPTNSGKTYAALEALKAAPTGVYCGPLRLLAMEVFDTLNTSGTFCNLITGQETKMVPGAEHTSCTIETTSVTKRVDVAVIDEIQLLGDEQRGWAWTRALQGLPANEIHLCGDSSAIPLVSALARAMGEEFEVRKYRRFTPVKVQEEGLPQGYKDVAPGDCVVAFSRKAIYEIKSFIEYHTGMRTCVVYGALPPETRRQQARLFNEPGNDFNVMVASDAVGMGLNLNIRRIIFNSLSKFDGVMTKQISVSEIKQIAGRAGRRNSQFPKGYATCLDKEEVPAVKAAMKTPQSKLVTPAAGLFPEFEHLEAYAGKSLQSDFVEVLKHFAEEAKLDGIYFFCRQDSMELAAKLLARVEGLSLQERYWFCMAPMNLGDPRQSSALLHFASRYAARLPVTLELNHTKDIDVPRTPDELQKLEQLHQVMSAWLWLANRFNDPLFPGVERVMQLSEEFVEKMHTALEQMYQEGAPPVSWERKPVDEIVKEMQTSYLTNLSIEAKEHLREASKNKINSFLARHQAQVKQRRYQALRNLSSSGPRTVERAFA